MTLLSRFSRFRLQEYEALLVFAVFSILYVFLAWLVCGGDRWWIIDYVDNSNVFYGDDAYRFFLARSAWINPDLYTYNFVLPAFLVLEGIVVSIAGGDLLLSRCIHALMGGLVVALVWRSGQLLDIRKEIMLPAILIMGLLPRFSLTSLSFYGEVWLVFILCIAILLYLHKKFLWVAVLVSLLPLIRPEGIFFWFPVWTFMLLKKKWLEASVILLPGLSYFVYINFALDSVSDYFYWRTELRSILNKLVLNKSEMDWLETYSVFLVFPAFFGWLYAPIRVIWPFLVGGAIWFGWLLLLFVAGYSDYEDRYTYILIPIIILLWAGFVAWGWARASRARISSRWLALGVMSSGLLVIVLHLSNMYMIKGSVKLLGIQETLSYIARGKWEDLFLYNSLQTVDAWREAVENIHYLLDNDHGIDKLAIFDHGFYYYLDPIRIPRHVTVGYATNGHRVFHILFDGQVFTQHPGGEMYSYLDFFKPGFIPGEKRAIYVDIMPLSGYPYAWKFAEYEMYLFGYKRSLRPRKSLDDAPMIDLERMKEAYERWW